VPSDNKTKTKVLDWLEETEKTGTKGETKLRMHRARREGVVFFKNHTEQKSSISNHVLLQRQWEERAAVWLNPMSAKTQQCLASETQDKRAFGRERIILKNNLLSSESTLLERAAILEQVSSQKNDVPTRHTMQMPTLV